MRAANTRSMMTLVSTTNRLGKTTVGSLKSKRLPAIRLIVFGLFETALPISWSDQHVWIENAQDQFIELLGKPWVGRSIGLNDLPMLLNQTFKIGVGRFVRSDLRNHVETPRLQSLESHSTPSLSLLCQRACLGLRFLAEVEGAGAEVAAGDGIVDVQADAGAVGQHDVAVLDHRLLLDRQLVPTGIVDPVPFQHQEVGD